MWRRSIFTPEFEPDSRKIRGKAVAKTERSERYQLNSVNGRKIVSIDSDIAFYPTLT